MLASPLRIEDPARRHGYALAVALILLISTALRLWQLSTPDGDDVRRDLLRQGRQGHRRRPRRHPRARTGGRPATRCRGRIPEMGKFAIAAGILLFGDRSFGWRLPGGHRRHRHPRLRVPARTPARPLSSLGDHRPAVRRRRPPRASRSPASRRWTSSSPCGRCSASCWPCATCRTAGAPAGSSCAAPRAAWPWPPSGPAASPSSRRCSSSSSPGSCSGARRAERPRTPKQDDDRRRARASPRSARSV